MKTFKEQLHAPVLTCKLGWLVVTHVKQDSEGP